MLHAFRVRLAIAPCARPCTCLPAKKKEKEKEKNRAEQEARRTSDGSGYAARMARCTLKEDPEDGKGTVSAGKLGGNASGRSAQQSPCWSLTSCALL